MDSIINAAPMVIQLGTQDLSKRKLARVAVAVPQHCPKFFIYAQRGLSVPQLLSGNERITAYGENTFDLRGKYANHQTLFANAVDAAGNAAMYQRLIPEDAGPAANVALWLDVLPTKVDIYQRNDDGSIATDDKESPIITGTADGFKVKWVVTHNTEDKNQAQFGAQKIANGNQVDVTTGVQSKRYPIFEAIVSSQGAYGNNCGLRFWAPTTTSGDSIPTKMMAQERAFPYYISVIERDTALSTPEVIASQDGEPAVQVVFKEGVIDPTYDTELFIGDVLLNKYQNLTDTRYPTLIGNFGRLAIYTENLNSLLAQFHAAEVPFISDYHDFSAVASDLHLFNFVSGVSSTDVPYNTYQFVDDDDSVRPSQYVNIYAAGGSDGTMSNEKFDELVAKAMDDYADPLSSVQDIAVNVEKIIYDSGFGMDTKFALCKFVAIRKNTFVVHSAFVDGEGKLTETQERSRAIALRARMQNYPESDYFGTPVMRGMIVGRSGLLRNSQWKKRVPLTYEVAVKSAKYMGASNGAWTNGESFSASPNNIVDSMYDINITWVPNTVRNKNWDAGLVWVQNFDRNSQYFPALKTVCNDGTSVLNSYFTALAICELNNIANAVHREFTGVDNMTGAQLIDAVNNSVLSSVKGNFDNRFVIQPDCQITDMDALRGYSWTLPIKIYANNMKTVMTTYVQAFRMEDLNAAA